MDVYKKIIDYTYIEFYKTTIDKLEAVISHNEADLLTWIPLEYELNLTYGSKDCEWYDTMMKLREIVKEDTLNKLDEVINEQ